jgi:hypothetical protein
MSTVVSRSTEAEVLDVSTKDPDELMVPFIVPLDIEGILINRLLIGEIMHLLQYH